MAHLYDIFKDEELAIAEKIQRRRYQMLVHSYIYYELNENIISDAQWSSWAMELVELQSKYPNIAKQVIYADDFKDWDGSSGAFLTYADKPNITFTAHRLLRSSGTKKPTIVVPQPKKPVSKPSTAKRKLF